MHRGDFFYGVSLLLQHLIAQFETFGPFVSNSIDLDLQENLAICLPVFYKPKKLKV